MTYKDRESENGKGIKGEENAAVKASASESKREKKRSRKHGSSVGRSKFSRVMSSLFDFDELHKKDIAVLLIHALASAVFMLAFILAFAWFCDKFL